MGVEGDVGLVGAMVDEEAMDAEADDDEGANSEDDDAEKSSLMSWSLELLARIFTGVLGATPSETLPLCRSSGIPALRGDTDVVIPTTIGSTMNDPSAR